jgi:hypothetical protein
MIVFCFYKTSKTSYKGMYSKIFHIKARIFKLVRSPGIDFMDSVPPAYLAWRGGPVH